METPSPSVPDVQLWDSNTLHMEVETKAQPSSTPKRIRAPEKEAATSKTNSMSTPQEGSGISTPERISVEENETATCITILIRTPGKEAPVAQEVISTHPKRISSTVNKTDASASDKNVSHRKEVTTIMPYTEGTRVAHTLLEQSILENGGVQPSIYKLPTIFESNIGFRKHRLGQINLRQTHKVIMIVGATGSGKTTLINGMINYILGVEWKDEFRFKLIDEVVQKSQAHSQTSEVTAYEIQTGTGYKIPYSLTIIDTPGFGDTRGIEQDKKITDQIREFFSKPGGIDHIDAVCCLVQASAARLTHTQKYVFDSVLSIFGKDIEENIQVLITFADGQAPPVLDAIKASDIPCPKDSQGNPVHFKFNNSALFASNSKAEGDFASIFNEMFWKMGSTSMKTFFDSLVKLEPKSLRLTKEVLRERKTLEAAVQGLQPQIKAGLHKLEQLRQTRQVLQQHKDDMDANKDFEYEVDKHESKKIEITEYITNCSKCHFTCHYPCGIADDSRKAGCAAMDRHGNCTICPGKCCWNVHFNQKYKFEYYTIKVKETYANLKAKYEEASGEVMTGEKLMEELKLDYYRVKMAVVGLIERSSRSLHRLQEIALKPNPLATAEYIDLMIESEKREMTEGYLDRLNALHRVREQAVLITKIENKELLLPEEQEQHENDQKMTAKMYVKKGYDAVKTFFSDRFT